MPRALRERGLGFPLEHRNCCQMCQTPRAVCADEVTQYSPHTLPRMVSLLSGSFLHKRTTRTMPCVLTRNINLVRQVGLASIGF